ncbi:MAG: preprotein translocase subunit SecG [Desulfobacterales bacterium]
MTILIIALHIFVCIALIMIVLLQTGKGADMGAAFGGGGSQTLFGTTGASTFLSKATTVAAVVFMVTCFLLAYMSSNRQAASIMENEKPAIEETVPGQQTASEIPVAPAPNGDKPEKTN